MAVTCGWLNATRALSHKDRFRKLHKVKHIHSIDLHILWAKELYMSSVTRRTNVSDSFRPTFTPIVSVGSKKEREIELKSKIPI